MDMKKFLFFETMIAPKIIIFVYWLQSLVIIFMGLFSDLISGFWVRLLGIVLGLLAVRILAEITLLAFKCNGYLKRIAEKS